MNAKTLTALKGSIKKWEAIVMGTGKDNGTLNCPLCAVFYKANCDGCPVREKTGSYGCNGTPYEDLDELMDDEGARHPRSIADVSSDKVPLARSYAEAELKFLQSLLPTEGEEA